MSNSIMRRNSSKQGLQNLMRVMAQRSMEDAEEIERERRRRSKEKQSIQGGISSPTSRPQDNGLLAEGTVVDSELKPSCQLVLEEDEGFSDWTHKLEKHKQRHLNEQEVQEDQRPKENRSSKPRQTSHSEGGGEREQREHKPQDTSRRNTAEKVTDQKKSVKMSYTSKVFMPQDVRHSHINGQAAERTSYLVAGTLSPCATLPDLSEMDGEVAEAFPETEKSPGKVASSHMEEEETEKSPLKVPSSHMEEEETEKSPEKVQSSQMEEEETEKSPGKVPSSHMEEEETEKSPLKVSSSHMEEEETEKSPLKVPSSQMEEEETEKSPLKVSSSHMEEEETEKSPLKVSSSHMEEEETEKSPLKVPSSHMEEEEIEKSPLKEPSSHLEEEETEKSPGKVSSSHTEEEETEGLVGLMEQQQLEELNRRGEERRRVREEEEERQREEEEQRRKVQEKEETQKRTEDIERSRVKRLSLSSSEGDESTGPFSPMSPTFKNEMEERMTTESTCTINDRTESLNRSVKKSSSIKKTLPPVAVSKIDDRLEQYTHAIKISSNEANTPKQVLMDLPSPTEPVASKKSLFEVGDAWSQYSVKITPSKDAEGLKVGVADLINQWVKGSPDDPCRSSSSKPAEIKPGDVLSKKNIWENRGEMSSPGRGGKGSSSSKKYKYMVTGHGKYEKVAVDEDGNEYANGP